MAREKKIVEVEAEEVKTTPKEYFDMLKASVETASEENLKQMYENACAMIQKYIVTGQSKGAEKLYKFATMTAKEMGVLRHGIDKYITRANVTKFISEVSDKAVVIIELENYEREIPDEIVDKIATLKENNVFDQYFIIFTDYTGETRSMVAKEKRDRDPILLGALSVDGHLNNRLYYIDSWEDDKCDLTLDKLIASFEAKNLESPVIDIIKEYPTMKEFKDALTMSEGVDD